MGHKFRTCGGERSEPSVCPRICVPEPPLSLCVLMDGKLEILAGVGVDSSWNLGGRGDLNRKIFPQGSLLTLTSHIIFEARKKELCNGKSCSLSVYSVLTSYTLSVQVFIHVGPVNHEEPAQQMDNNSFTTFDWARNAWNIFTVPSPPTPVLCNINPGEHPQKCARKHDKFGSQLYFSVLFRQPKNLFYWTACVCTIWV